MSGKKNLWVICLYALLFMCVFAACDPEVPCRENMQVALGISFHDYVSEADSSMDTAYVKVLSANEQLYIDSSFVDVKTLYVPLFNDSHATKIVLKVNAEPADTINLTYTTNLQMVNFECGFLLFFKDIEVTNTHNTLKSLKILNTQVTNVQTSHIQVLY